MRKYMLTMLLLAAAAPAQAQDRLEARLRAGCIYHLKNARTGEVFALAPTREPNGAGILRPGREPLRLSTQARITRREHGGVLTESAAWRDAAGEIGALTTRLARETRGLALTQSGTVREKGLSALAWSIAEVPDTVQVLVPGASGQMFGVSAPQGRRVFEYPLTWECRFVLLQGRSGGILIYSSDQRRFQALTVEHVGRAFRLLFESRPDAPYEEKRAHESLVWRMEPYIGDWHIGAGRYREVLAAQGLWTPLRRHGPAWAAQIQTVVTMGMDIPMLSELAGAMDPRKTLLYIADWRRDGYDRNYPDYTASEKFGPFVREAHRLGFRVMPHVNYFGCDPKHPLYQKFSRYHMRDPVSGEHLWWDWPFADPPIRFAYINPASAEWRQLMVERLSEIVRLYGVDAFHLDQTLCIFNDRNGPINGLNCVDGNVLLHQELRRALPDVALSGEGLNEVTCRYESFAQRHVWGMDHVKGTWDDRQIAMAHPVSSAVLLPATRMYGYLGMPNPARSPDLYHAWRRAYEHYGVLPTYAWPEAGQTVGTDPILRTLLAEIRFWQSLDPEPDFERAWRPEELFAYRLRGGGRAAYVRDQGVALVEGAGATAQTITRRIEGVRVARVPGSVPGWPVYDAQAIRGLNPRRSYAWSPAPRDMHALRMDDVPEGFQLESAGRHPQYARFVFAPVPAAERPGVIRLWDVISGSVGGVAMADGSITRHPLPGWEDPRTGARIQPEGEGWAVHPPWKALPTPRGPGGARHVAFQEIAVRVPKAERVVLECALLIESAAAGRSDGIRLRVSATGPQGTVSAEAMAASASPVPLRLDLSRFSGGRATVRFEIDAGERGDPTFDWGRISRPIVYAEGEPSARRAQITLRGRGLPDRALVGRGEARFTQPSAESLVLTLDLPNSVVLPFGVPRDARLPLNLWEEPWNAVTIFPSGQEGGPPVFRPGAGPTTSSGVERLSLNAHPPNGGRTALDFHIRMPEEPCELVSAVGIRDGAKTGGVGFEVAVNGTVLWRKALPGPDGWHAVEVDLSAYRGREVLLSLITDSLGDYSFDWAAWAEPRLVPRGRTAAR